MNPLRHVLKLLLYMHHVLLDGVKRCFCSNFIRTPDVNPVTHKHTLQTRTSSHPDGETHSRTHPIMGCLKPSLTPVSRISFSSHGCGRTRYLTNWDTHQTDGSPCSLCRRAARSSGIARGRYGGLGWRLSTMGNSTTWTSRSRASPAETLRVNVTEKERNALAHLSKETICLWRFHLNCRKWERKHWLFLAKKSVCRHLCAKNNNPRDEKSCWNMKT